MAERAKGFEECGWRITYDASPGFLRELGAA